MKKRGIKKVSVWLALLSVVIVCAIAALPIISDVSLSSNNADTPLNGNLTITLTATDSQADEVKNITTWFVNGKSLMSLQLPFEGGSNSTFTKDYSNNSYDGTVVGATWSNNTGYDGWGAYEFSGSGQKIEISQDLTSAAVTITFWIKPNSLSGLDSIYRAFNDGIYLNNGNIWLYNQGSFRGSSSSKLQTGTWQHVAVSFKENIVKYYINGIADGTATNGVAPLGLANFDIGSDDYNQHLDAVLDEFTIYNRSLSAEQIYAIYQNKTALIAIQEVGRDTWRAGVTPTNKSSNGTIIYSNPLAQNYVPGITNLQVNTTSKSNRSSNNITAHWENNQTNAEAGKNISDWRVNGKSLALIHLPFEGASNITSTKDYSTFDREITVSGATYQLGQDKNQKFGSYYFDGSSYIDLSDFDIDDNFTVSFWVNPSTTNNGQAFIAKNDASGGNYFIFGFYSDGYFTLLHTESYTVGTKETGWQHLVIQASKSSAGGTDVTIYKNGVIIGQNSFSNTVGDFSGKEWSLGQEWDSSSRSDFLTGYLDQVFIFNHTLSYEQIQLLYLEDYSSIASNETKSGQSWSVALTSTDGQDNAATQYSNSVLIRNTSTIVNLSLSIDVTPNPLLTSQSLFINGLLNTTANSGLANTSIKLYINGSLQNRSENTWDNKNFSYRKKVTFVQPYNFTNRSAEHALFAFNISEGRLSNATSPQVYCNSNRVPFESYALQTSGPWVTELEGLIELNFTGSENKTCFVYYDSSFNGTNNSLKVTGWYAVGNTAGSGSVDTDITPSESDCNQEYSSLNSGSFTICSDTESFHTNAWCYFKADSTGTEYFKTGSDDGSRLEIYGTGVVTDNDGNHALQYRDGSYTTIAGRFYPLEINYGENTGGNELYVKYGSAGDNSNGDVIDTECYPFYGDSWQLNITKESEEVLILTNQSGHYSYNVSQLSEGHSEIKVNTTYSSSYAEDSSIVTAQRAPEIISILTNVTAQVNQTLHLVANITDQNIASVTFSVSDGNGELIFYRQSGNNGGSDFWNSSQFTLNISNTYNYSIIATDSDGLSSTSGGVIDFITITAELRPSTVGASEIFSAYGLINFTNGTLLQNKLISIAVDGIIQTISIAVSWWNLDWPYRTQINLNSNISTTINNSITLVNFSTIDYINNGLMNSDCSDVRFTDNNTKKLNYTLSPITCNTSNTLFWLWHNLTGSANTTIFAYYGNPSTTLPLEYINQDPNLFIYYHFDNATIYGENSTQVYDFSKNGNNATLTTGQEFINYSSRFGGAIQFDGVNDNIRIIDGSTPTSYTVIGWVKAVDNTSVSIVARTTSNGPGINWNNQLRINSAGKFEHYGYDGGGKAATGTTNVQKHTWYHVAAVGISGSNLQLYVNGVQEATRSIGAFSGSEDRWDIADSSGDGMGHYNGLIDELQIYNRSLSTDEIKALYNTTKSFIVANESQFSTNSTGEYDEEVTAPDSAGTYEVLTNITYQGFYAQSVKTLTVDTNNPNVEDISPKGHPTQQFNSYITIAANVTDAGGVDRVFANITLPNGSNEFQELTYNSGNEYRLSYFIPKDQGVFDVNITANDTTARINNTQSVQFSAYDFVPPNVTNLTPITASTFETGENVAIKANVTDELGLNIYQAIITFPNASTQTIDIYLQANTNIYNRSYILPNAIGNYTILFSIQDIAGNTNASESVEISVIDASAPNASIVTPLDGASFNQNDEITLAANFTDNIGFGNLKVSVIAPDSFMYLVDLVFNPTTQFYESIFKATSQIGTYLLSITAQDTSGNQNQSTTYSFTVTDQGYLQLLNVTPTLNQSINQSAVFNLSIVAQGSNPIDQVFANVTLPNSTIYRIRLLNTTHSNGTLFQAELNRTDLAGSYNITFIANDTLNSYSFAQARLGVNDTTLPTLIDVFCSPKTAGYNATIRCNLSVSDDIEVANVTANVTLPNSSVEDVEVTNTGTNYTFIFNNTPIIKNYNVSWKATDSSGNFIVVPSQFNITQPAINPLGCNPNPTNLTIATNCSVNVTSALDFYPVDDVWANILLPNNTNRTLSLTQQGSVYSVIFQETNLTGVYNIIWYANDTAATISSNTDSFTTQDVTTPRIGNYSPISTDSVNETNSILLSVNITEDYLVSGVFANLTYPNGSVQWLELSYTSGVEYALTFTTDYSIGTYNISYIVNDTSNNRNTSITTSFSVNGTDDDNDGISDAIDTLIGNGTFINGTGLTNISLTIGGNISNGSFNNLQEVLIYDNNTLIINFSHNFSQKSLDLRNITLNISTDYLLVNMSDLLNKTTTKTLYLTDNNYTELCAYDAQIQDASVISTDCTGDNETNLDACIGVSTRTQIGTFICHDDGSTLIVENLSHSGLRGSITTSSSESSPSSSGGSGGGGGAGGSGGGGGGSSLIKKEEPIKEETSKQAASSEEPSSEDQGLAQELQERAKRTAALVGQAIRSAAAAKYAKEILIVVSTLPVGLVVGLGSIRYYQRRRDIEIPPSVRGWVRTNLEQGVSGHEINKILKHKTLLRRNERRKLIKEEKKKAS